MESSIHDAKICEGCIRRAFCEESKTICKDFDDFLSTGHINEREGLLRRPSKARYARRFSKYKPTEEELEKWKNGHRSTLTTSVPSVRKS